MQFSTEAGEYIFLYYIIQLFDVLRCVEEPVRTIRGVHYHQANATSIDFDNQVIKCKDLYTHYETNYKDLYFELRYDKLAIAVGQKSNTFGLIESREEEGNSPSGTDRQNVFFLKREFSAIKTNGRSY